MAARLGAIRLDIARRRSGGAPFEREAVKVRREDLVHDDGARRLPPTAERNGQSERSIETAE